MTVFALAVIALGILGAAMFLRLVVVDMIDAVRWSRRRFRREPRGFEVLARPIGKGDRQEPKDREL